MVTFEDDHPSRTMFCLGCLTSADCGDQSLLDRRYLRAVRVLIYVSLAWVSLAWASPAWARDLALVANKANRESAISQADLVKACKAQNSHWPDGKSITFVMRAPSAPEMKVILEKIYGMSEADVKQPHCVLESGTDGPSRHRGRRFRRGAGE